MPRLRRAKRNFTRCSCNSENKIYFVLVYEIPGINYLYNMSVLRVFFEHDPRLPDDILFEVKNMCVDRSVPERVMLKFADNSYMDGSNLNMKAVNAIRYGFAKTKDEAYAEKFYIEKELKTDEDFAEFYRIYEYEHHNDEVERTLETLDEKS